MPTPTFYPGQRDYIERLNELWAQAWSATGGTWGTIAGALSDQLDLASALGAKIDGSDARLSDARTPTSHAVSHATGGSDALFPGDIGAEIAGTASAAVSAHDAALLPHGFSQAGVDLAKAADAAAQRTLLGVGAGTVTEAPTDGQLYGRKDGAWAIAGSGSAAWGGITGVLADQADLTAALAGKAASVHGHASAELSDATPAGRALLTAADAAAQRTGLGLGSAAIKNIGTSGNVVPICNAANTLAGGQTIGDGQAGHLYLNGGATAYAQVVFKDASVGRARIGVPAGAAYLSLNGSDGFPNHMILTATGLVLLNTTAENGSGARLQVNGGITHHPPASLSPASNGELAIEATNNTTLTFKLKGTDGTVRTGTITLA